MIAHAAGLMARLSQEYPLCAMQRRCHMSVPLDIVHGIGKLLRTERPKQTIAKPSTCLKEVSLARLLAVCRSGDRKILPMSCSLAEGWW